MKPQYEELRRLCPGVEEGLIQEHLSRLEERYFTLFDRDQISEHLRALDRLSSDEPVQVLLKALPDRVVDCTVLAFDYPAEFSVITGILAASGLNILSGDIFTYERSSVSKPGYSKAGLRKKPGYVTGERLRYGKEKRAPLKRRRIIDRLSGYLDSPLAWPVWERQLKEKLSQAIKLLERGKNKSLNRARQMVNELVADRLSSLSLSTSSVLYPINIEVDNEGDKTKFKVVTQDTPFFLYALSTALALRGISIETVRIRTVNNRIEDEFSFLDAQGGKILQPDQLNQVKFSVLLTKQFTYFLGNAPDPYAALYRFEQLVEEILKLPEQRSWFELFSNPLILRDLARLLGASDFLWEEFIHLQYETLLPMLRPHLQGESFSRPLETLEARLNEALAGAAGPEARLRLLNEFRDREIYLFDLDHILNPEADFRVLSERLTCLAEAVIRTAVDLTYEQLIERYGTPRSIAELEAHYAILGLGKLGGGDLGYASDIELLFVYSDNGYTAGPESIPNSEFFNLWVLDYTRKIQTKQEGIFHIDLRLRPYGLAGPAACSLERFCRYYGPEGEAHALERLALVRLRAIGGDAELGARLERLRDEFLYSGKNIVPAELRSARQKQLTEYIKEGQLNAKLSPGALVDLEYTVQLLQIMYGAEHDELKTPRIREALKTFEALGILKSSEAERIRLAYNFFHRLINSLRMLRGSARDLMLPGLDSVEYVHLARRMGFTAGQSLTPAQQLHLEFETHTASIRVFVEQHLGRESLPGPAAGNVVDLILSDNPSPCLRQKILANIGFKQVDRAYVNLRGLAGSGSRLKVFARLAVLAVDLLQHQPDPDMALNNWERFIGALKEPGEHFRLLLSQPKRLEILLSLFAGSQFLSDTLIRNPDFFEWVTLPEHLHRLRERQDMRAFFKDLSKKSVSRRDWLNQLRIYKRREILRIGIRDIFIGAPIVDIMRELSMLAEAVMEAALDRVWKELSGAHYSSGFCILALGKLGGEELNYSSDIDLLAVTREKLTEPAGEQCNRAMERLRSDLSGHTEEGYVYRVDLRLRPYGKSGELVSSLSALVGYYEKEASLWEIQALIKARPVAGNLRLGQQFMKKVRALLLKAYDRRELINSIESMRKQIFKKRSGDISAEVNVKLSSGGIRDVEFLVQALQLLYAHEHPELLGGNTVKALAELGKTVLAKAAAEHLKEDYLFLRRIEHFLQIHEDLQTHTLPDDPAALDTLAKRLLGLEADSGLFLERVLSCLARVEKAFNTHLAAN